MNTLLLLDYLHWPAHNGGAQRTWNLIRSLALISNVYVLITREGALLSEIKTPVECEYVNLIKEIFVIPSPTPIKIFQKIKSWLTFLFPSYAIKYGRRNKYIYSILLKNGINLIISRYASPAINMRLFVRDINIPYIIDIDDFPSWAKPGKDNICKNIAISFRVVMGRLRIKHDRLVFKKTIGSAAHIWITAPEDQIFLNFKNVSVLPNIPFPDQIYLKKIYSKREILFVGTLSYEPNAQAIQWFIKEVWPFVLDSMPRRQLLIAGSGISQELQSVCHSAVNVQALGHVDCLSSLYDRCTLAIAPILNGGGTKIKVLEALSFGVPCVVSRHAARGLDNLFNEDSGLFVCNTPDDYIMHIRKIFCLALEQQEAIGNNARDKVEQMFSFSRFSDEVKATVGQVCSNVHKSM